MEGGLWDVVLYGVALALVIWILVPAVAFALGGFGARSGSKLRWPSPRGTTRTISAGSGSSRRWGFGHSDSARSRAGS